MTASDAPYELLRDPKSFIEPLERAIADANAVLTTRQRAGGKPSARLFRALTDHEALTDFVAEVTRRLSGGTLHELPSVRRGFSRLRGFHQLTHGRFRGIFLVDRATRQAVALLFTQSPHRIDGRLEEIARPYLPRDDEREEAEDE